MGNSVTGGLPWAALGVGLVVTNCAYLVGLTGDYEVGESDRGGAAGSTVTQGGEGGAGTGSGGAAGDHAGSSGDAGAGGESGTSGGTGPSGGAAGAGGEGGSGGSATVPPSCAELEPTCGANGDAPCCGSGSIRSGGFDRSNDERYPATISDFRLDLYEVTVGRFRKFVEATNGTYRPETGSGKNPNNADDPGWKAEFNDELPIDRNELTGPDVGVNCEPPFPTWTDAPGDNESRPINCVTWYVAFAFCIWDGGRLPTETEWNFAAAGGSQQRHFPWSFPPETTTIDASYASYFDVATTSCVGDGRMGCAVTDFVVVGSKPAGRGRFGHSDLAGNVYEWTIDTFGPYPEECNDCANFSGSGRVGRGGSYVNFEGLLATADRMQDPPTYRSSAFGIRCARAASGN